MCYWKPLTNSLRAFLPAEEGRTLIYNPKTAKSQVGPKKAAFSTVKVVFAILDIWWNKTTKGTRA
jgi:hypothetical protein